jgi:hypothetical protein
VGRKFRFASRDGCEPAVASIGDARVDERLRDSWTERAVRNPI